MSEIFWSVDSLVVKDNALFGFGWVFHAKHEITALRFKLTFAGEGKFLPAYIATDAGKPREDVESAFANQPNALNSGYVVFGAFPVGAQISAVTLVCSLADGSVLELAVPTSSVIQFTSANESESNRLMLRQFYVFFKRGMHLIRAGKFTTLFEKVRRYIRSRPNSGLHKPTALAGLLRRDERKNVCLIIDHNLGGGANHYSNRLVNSIIHEGRSALILSYHVATLSHMLILRNNRVNLRYSIPDKSFFQNAVKTLSITDIIYNTAVSFIKPEEIPPLLINLKQHTSARLKVLIHDFFPVCPSHFLIDHKGKYCQIPEIDVCSSCLQRNQQGFTSLFHDRSMPKWRVGWGSLLEIADEIVTFSNNSSKLLLKAYPHIEGIKISVLPHKVDYLSGKLPQISNTSMLCIGIVGQIGFHKGSVFVQALAREIKRRDLDLKIVVIGSVEASCEPSIVSQTGAYRHDDLKGLIEKSNANVFLFPSIWPETFSYVVQELMEMDVPIASFNFGAPAERLASYAKGLVLDSMDSGIVLDQLLSFHRKTYLAY